MTLSDSRVLYRGALPALMLACSAFLLSACTSSDPSQRRSVNVGTFNTGGTSISSGAVGLSVPLIGDQASATAGPATVNLSKVSTPEYMKRLERELYVAFSSERHAKTASLSMPDSETVAVQVNNAGSLLANGNLSVDAQGMLDKLATALNKYTDTRVRFSSSSPVKPGEPNLSALVSEYLVSLGISSARITAETSDASKGQVGPVPAQSFTLLISSLSRT